MSERAAISMSTMAELRASGAAAPLLPEYDIGPMRYAGRWWYVVADGPTEDYVPAPPELVAQLERMKAELDGLQALVVDRAETAGRPR